MTTHSPNMQPLDTESCPAALLEYAGRRMMEWSDAFDLDDDTDDRPWYHKYIYGAKKKRWPPEYVELRLFSECDFEKIDCAGRLIGNWHLQFIPELRKVIVGCVPTEPPPDTGHLKNAIVTYVWPVFYNCALSCTADRCVIVEIDEEGGVSRAVYELPQGTKSLQLGPMIGEIKCERIKRLGPDTCMPAGWKPAAK